MEKIILFTFLSDIEMRMNCWSCNICDTIVYNQFKAKQYVKKYILEIIEDMILASITKVKKAQLLFSMFNKFFMSIQWLFLHQILSLQILRFLDRNKRSMLWSYPFSITNSSMIMTKEFSSQNRDDRSSYKSKISHNLSKWQSCHRRQKISNITIFYISFNPISMNISMQ